MSKPLDEFPLSIAEYLADTGHLSTVQHGAYLLILMTMRRSGGWLPDDDRKLANIVKLSLARWQQIASDIRSLLIADAGKMTQKRVLADIQKLEQLRIQNAANGKKGGKAKALKNNNPDVATARNSPAERQPEEVAGTLPLKDSSSSEKRKGGTRGSALPSDWMPSELDYSYGDKLGLTPKQVDACGEDLRLWARGNANRAVGRKADWTATFHGWMRREAPKLTRNNKFAGGLNGNAGAHQPARGADAVLAAARRRAGAGDRSDGLGERGADALFTPDGVASPYERGAR